METQTIISYLTFSLGNEHFALNVSKVVNILEMQEVTEVPQSPEYFTGVINLRGEVLAVIDTKIKLGMDKTSTTGNTCILVIETVVDDLHTRFGILVDSVQEVLEIEDENILPSPSIGHVYKTDFITGVIERGDKFVMLMDINVLLNTEELLAMQQIDNTVN